ncbi:MAG: alcohol dehydrogenase catalytic domain-containing protein [candidate division KSB1 bacterium]|nr:alcohol dehydrogenase catalytic domain-containing protein [candidate division KSB1 bacterium]
MLALQFDGTLKLREVDVPRPRQGEALIRMRVAGICNTDLEITRGYFGFRGTLGHEFVGEVIEAPGNEEWVGARVVGEINLACGACWYCQRDLQRHCPNRTVLGIAGKDGCFAEYLTLPVRNLHRVPADLDDEVAVFTEPLAASLEILEQVRVAPGSLVCVIGDGKLGLLAAQVLLLTGANVHIVGKHRHKLAVAESFGAKPVDSDALSDKQYPLVVEASGSPAGLERAIRLVRPRGTIVLKSTYAEKPCVDTSRLVVDEVQVVGSRCGPFEPALRLLVREGVRTRPLVSGTFPLSRGLEAFAKAQEAGALKVLLRNEGW